jgi:DNA-binding IclR family transcriptional regulator
MDNWWSEIDGAVLACLREPEGMSPHEIGRRLGMSEAAAVSILSMLVQEGRVRIVSAETTPGPAGRHVGAAMAIGGGA